MSPDLALMRNPIMSSTASRFQPYPQTMSPQVAAMRARDQQLQQALNQRYPSGGYPPQKLPPIPASSQSTYSQALNEAARRAALMANQSQIERGVPMRPVGSSAKNIANQRAEQLGLRPANPNARLPMGGPAQNYDAGINGPAGLTRTQYAGLNRPVAPARPVTPVPMMASSGLQNRRMLPPNAAPPAAPVRVAQPAYAPVQSSPARVIINGANSYVAPPAMTPVQALQASGLSPSQAYQALTQRGSSLEDRVTGRSSNSGASAYSLV